MEFRKSPETLAVLVVGTDTLIEALPARPIQLAHACGALGFDLVVPLSWGDELVAEAALRALEPRDHTPAVCAPAHLLGSACCRQAEISPRPWYPWHHRPSPLRGISVLCSATALVH